MVVQLCWWCQQCHQERSSQQSSRLPHPIDPHIKFTIGLPETDGLPFLDTLTKSTPNSIESTVYRTPTHTDRTLDHNSNHAILTKLSVIHTLIHRAKHVCSTSEISWKINGSPPQSPTKQSLDSIVLSTRQTPNRKQTESQIHPQENS